MHGNRLSGGLHGTAKHHKKPRQRGHIAEKLLPLQLHKPLPHTSPTAMTGLRRLPECPAEEPEA